MLFLLIVSSFLLLAPSSWPDRPELPAPRPPTAFSGPPLPWPPLLPGRGGGPSRAAHQSNRPEPPLPPASPAPCRRPPIALRARPARSPNRERLGRRRPAPPALRRGSAGGRAGPQHSPGGATQRRSLAAALLLAGCWAEAASEAGATGRPERRLSSAGARGAGPRTEEEAAPRLPGPGACPEGGRCRPFLARSVPAASPGEAPRAPGCPLGVPSAAPDSPARAAGAQVRGRARGRAPPPTASGAGAGPSSASRVRQPRPVAQRELPGDRGAGCCPPARPLARRPPPQPLPPGPCPAVYMPVKPPATPSPSESRRPDGEASRPTNWTGRSDLGPPDSDPRPLSRLRHHLGGIGL
ncbi:protein FAM102A isoform X3 [Vulpes lagopus]|uniref:protein FAM102A isoform X3 n=1 Tax=Vulpes lagopus TaxID=494514 RepID=UPI001BCA0D7D|nr:protein FAM102A isoform X3 [Vulpes lagopus]